MQITLREEEVKEAFATYLKVKFNRSGLQAKDISNVKIRRRISKSEEVGSVVVTLRETK
jgi:hypothetical protein